MHTRQRDVTDNLIVAAFAIAVKDNATDIFLDQELYNKKIVECWCHTCLTGSAILMFTDNVCRLPMLRTEAHLMTWFRSTSRSWMILSLFDFEMPGIPALTPLPATKALGNSLWQVEFSFVHHALLLGGPHVYRSDLDMLCNVQRASLQCHFFLVHVGSWTESPPLLQWGLRSPVEVDVVLVV
jgi:hypothetical protein